MSLSTPIQVPSLILLTSKKEGKRIKIQLSAISPTHGLPFSIHTSAFINLSISGEEGKGMNI